MNTVGNLLRPRIWALRNSGRSSKSKRGIFKLLFLGILGALFWAGLFAIVFRVLSYFKSIEQIGDILAFKLLSMTLITAFALLIFSGILTALSKLYLSRDLFLVHSLPAPSRAIFISRWIESLIDSSWMVVVFTLPVFIAYGIIYQSGALYYLTVGLSLIPLGITAAALSALLVVGAVMVVPASRMKNIFVFLSILLFVVVYIAIRMLKPEQLVDPEVFETVMVYVTMLETPSSPWLPSTWAFDALRAALTGASAASGFHLALAWSCAGLMFCLLTAAAEAFYFRGFSRTQTAAVRMFRRQRPAGGLPKLFSGPVRAFIGKEVKAFFRDQTQWSQIFLVAALVVIYIYNFKVLPLEKSPIKTIYLQNLLSFLNMGLALFVTTAIAARFAYPAVSTEADAFWIVRASPISLKRFLWIKFAIYCMPLLLLSEILTVVTNILLHVTPFMMTLSTLNVLCLLPGIVAMAIGLGAAYPDFQAENPAQSATSFGGLLFMMLCAGYIGLTILLEAGPVYRIFIADLTGRSLGNAEWLWIVGSFAGVLAIGVLALIIPMRFGAARLTALTS
jgi:ABC-2 type transport system permease protein